MAGVYTIFVMCNLVVKEELILLVSLIGRINLSNFVNGKLLSVDSTLHHVKKVCMLF